MMICQKNDVTLHSPRKVVHDGLCHYCIRNIYGASSPADVCQGKVAQSGLSIIFAPVSSESVQSDINRQAFQFNTKTIDKQFSLTRQKLTSDFRKRQ